MMLRRVLWLFLIAWLGFGLSACGTAPAVTEIPAAEFPLVMSEYFDGNSNQWQLFKEEGTGEVKFFDHKLRMIVEKPDTHLWVNPDVSATKSLQDVTISVKATKESLENADSKAVSESNNLFGVICRYQDSKNFYFLVISSDGYFGIGKVIQGEYQLINRKDYPPSQAIYTDQRQNKIYAECVGSTLSLYVNDQLVDRQIDMSLKQGNVGLITGTRGNTTVIDFDDFEVKGR